VANYYTGTANLKLRVQSTPWAAILPGLEAEFTDPHELAPRSLEEAIEQIDMVLELVGDIAANEVAPKAAEVDRIGARLKDGRVIYPQPMQDSFKLMGEAGLLGFTLPREHGGMNLSAVAYTAAVEMVARADASLMTLFALQGCGETIHRYGTPELQAKYLPRLCTGEITPCMALTEPNAGSELGAVTTRAHQDDAGQWWVRGSKCFITNGGADLLLVLARTEEQPGGAGLSLILVESGPGVEVSKLEEKLGIHGSATAVVNFDGAPGELVGERGAGLYGCTMGLLHNVRLEVAAQAVGIAQAAQSQAAQYAREREQFSRSIDRFAPVRTMLFENAVDIEAARAIIFTTAAVVDRRRGLHRSGGGAETERYDRIADLMTPLGKYYACEIVNQVTSRALQVHGGYGYTVDYPVERHMRDGRITNIYEGTSEIQVGAMIGPLVSGGLPLLFEEPLQDLGIEGLLDTYGTLLKAGDGVGKADRLAQQGWAKPFADATAALVAAMVFARDAIGKGDDDRTVVLARYQALQARHSAESVLRTVTDNERTTFDEMAFESVVEPYRSGA